MDKSGISEFTQPFIRSLAERGAFLCAPGNVMTIGWAQVGWMWAKPVVTVLVRPSRYSYGLMEQYGEFTVSVPYEGKMYAELSYVGRISARDEDKLNSRGIAALPARAVSAPIIAGCEVYAECKTLYKSDLTAESMDESVIKRGYPEGDFHRMYFAEIVKCYKG